MVCRQTTTIDLVAAAAVVAAMFAVEYFPSIDYVVDVVAVDFELDLANHSMEKIHFAILEMVIGSVAAIESKNFDLVHTNKKKNERNK